MKTWNKKHLNCQQTTLERKNFLQNGKWFRIRAVQFCIPPFCFAISGFSSSEFRCSSHYWILSSWSHERFCFHRKSVGGFWGMITFINLHYPAKMPSAEWRTDYLASYDGPVNQLNYWGLLQADPKVFSLSHLPREPRRLWWRIGPTLKVFEFCQVVNIRRRTYEKGPKILKAVSLLLLTSLHKDRFCKCGGWGWGWPGSELDQMSEHSYF